MIKSGEPGRFTNIQTHSLADGVLTTSVFVRVNSLSTTISPGVYVEVLKKLSYVSTYFLASVR